MKLVHFRWVPQLQWEVKEKRSKKGIVTRKSGLYRGLSQDETICPGFGTRIQAEIDRVAPNNIPKKKKFETVPTGGIRLLDFGGEKGVIRVTVMPRGQQGTLSGTLKF